VSDRPDVTSTDEAPNVGASFFVALAHLAHAAFPPGSSTIGNDSAPVLRPRSPLDRPLSVSLAAKAGGLSFVEYVWSLLRPLRKSAIVAPTRSN
jgi:hypothetical protein